MKLAVPDGKKRGSGLTVIVGPNNGGKSSIIESFKIMAKRNDCSFTEGQRNKKAGDKVEIVLEHHKNKEVNNEFNKVSLMTFSGGSEAKYPKGIFCSPISVLSSNRSFNPFSIGKSREVVTLRAQSGMLAYRGQQFDAVSKGKQVDALRNLQGVAGNSEFNEKMKKIYHKKFDW